MDTKRRSDEAMFRLAARLRDEITAGRIADERLILDAAEFWESESERARGAGLPFAAELHARDAAAIRARLPRREFSTAATPVGVAS